MLIKLVFLVIMVMPQNTLDQQNGHSAREPFTRVARCAAYSTTRVKTRVSKYAKTQDNCV